MPVVHSEETKQCEIVIQNINSIMVKIHKDLSVAHWTCSSILMHCAPMHPVRSIISILYFKYFKLYIVNICINVFVT